MVKHSDGVDYELPSVPGGVSRHRDFRNPDRPADVVAEGAKLRAPVAVAPAGRPRSATETSSLEVVVAEEVRGDDKRLDLSVKTDEADDFDLEDAVVILSGLVLAAVVVSIVYTNSIIGEMGVSPSAFGLEMAFMISMPIQITMFACFVIMEGSIAWLWAEGNGQKSSDSGVTKSPKLYPNRIPRYATYAVAMITGSYLLAVGVSIVCNIERSPAIVEIPLLRTFAIVLFVPAATASWRMWRHVAHDPNKASKPVTGSSPVRARGGSAVKTALQETTRKCWAAASVHLKRLAASKEKHPLLRSALCAAYFMMFILLCAGLAPRVAANDLRAMVTRFDSLACMTEMTSTSSPSRSGVEEVLDQQTVDRWCDESNIESESTDYCNVPPPMSTDPVSGQAIGDSIPAVIEYSCIARLPAKIGIRQPISLVVPTFQETLTLKLKVVCVSSCPDPWGSEVSRREIDPAFGTRTDDSNDASKTDPSPHDADSLAAGGDGVPGWSLAYMGSLGDRSLVVWPCVATSASSEASGSRVFDLALADGYVGRVRSLPVTQGTYFGKSGSVIRRSAGFKIWLVPGTTALRSCEDIPSPQHSEGDTVAR